MILYSIALGILLGIASIQRAINHDPVMKLLLQNAIEDFFADELQAHFSGTIERINIFFPELMIKEVHVTSKESDDWSWHAGTCMLSFSWLQCFMRGYAAVGVKLEEFSLHSLIRDDNLLIQHHIIAIIEGQTPLPIRFHELFFDAAPCTLHESEKRYCAQGLLSLKVGVCADRYRLKAKISQASLVAYNQLILEEIKIAGCFDSDKELASHEGSVTGSCKALFLPAHEQMCTIAAHLHRDKGQIVMHNRSKSCVITAYDMSLKHKNGRYHIALPAVAFKPYMPFVPSCFEKAALSSSGIFGYDAAQGAQLSAEIAVEVPHDEALFDRLQATIQLAAQEQSVDLSMHKEHATLMSALWRCDKKNKQSTLSCMVHEALEFGAWTCDAGTELRYSATAQEAAGSFACHATTPWFGPLTIAGSLQSADDAMTLAGMVNDHSYAMRATQTTMNVQLVDSKGKALLEGSLHDHTYALTMSIDAVQKLLKSMGVQGIVGHGLVDISGRLEHSIITGYCVLRAGALRLLKMHNLLRTASCTVSLDMQQKKFELHGGKALFDKGMVVVPRAIASLTDEYTLDNIHVPILLHALFVNYGKELSALVSGGLVFSVGANQRMALQGSAMLERARCNTAALVDLQQGGRSFSLPGVLHEPVSCEIILETKHDLHLNMPFMQTITQGQWVVRGTILHPDVVGTLHIREGKFLFPYHPLQITRGVMHFMPGNPHDPLIDFTARGKIRNYYIRMHCTGAAQDPHITFESSPPLTEEQIITLLFAGSEAGSLGMIMPAMVMQRLKSIVLDDKGNTQSSRGHYLKKLLSPLRFIRFIPHFNDQTARGGLRGAIEVDVTDHMRAIIQKNFSISEDSKIEVEYYLSDEVTLRAVKDERSDIGAEIEVRWKL